MLYKHTSATGPFLRYILQKQNTTSFSTTAADVSFRSESLPNILHGMPEELQTFHDSDVCDLEVGWRSQNCYHDIITAAKTRHRGGTIVIAITARGFYDIVINWVINMERLRIKNYIIVALDEDAHNFFLARGFPIVMLSQTKKVNSKGDIWIQRTFITYMILRAGLNVVVSDVDALLVKDPFEDDRFQEIQKEKMDIVTTASNFPNVRNGELPRECWENITPHIQWRHEACMGWIIFRSSDKMVSFFSRFFLSHVVKFRDDQIGLNCVLRKNGGVWGEGKDWNEKQDSKMEVMKAGRLKILMLAATRFVRNCTEFAGDKSKRFGLWGFEAKDVMMYHCKGANKRGNAKNIGLWCLREDWKGIPFVGRSFIQYVTEISS